MDMNDKKSINDKNSEIDPNDPQPRHQPIQNLDKLLLNLVKVIKFYQFPINEKLSIKHKNYFDIDKDLKSRKIPEYDKTVNYKELIKEANSTHKILKRCLGEAILEVNEKEIEYTKDSKKYFELELRSNPKWKKRRKNFQLKKDFKCPFEACGKFYASDASIQSHLKIKHLSGKKSERYQYSMDVFNALKNGQNLPETDLNLPENFLDTIKHEFKRLEDKGELEEFMPGRIFCYNNKK